MAASRSAQTSTSTPGTRARVNARARGRIRTPVEGGFVRSRYAPASEASVAAATALIDQRRGRAVGAEDAPRWGRKVAAGVGAITLSAVTGVFFAALVAASMFGLIVAILNYHR